MPLDPKAVLIQLRTAGVAAHHVAALSNNEVLVFLEGNLTQSGEAEDVIRRIPGTWRITYPAPATRAIMRVAAR